jgi:hypothetical protein
VTTWEIDQCFNGLAGIAHYQLIERGSVPMVLRYLPEPGSPRPEDLVTLRERLSALLQPGAGLVLEPVDTLLPETSGKFRLGIPRC